MEGNLIDDLFGVKQVFVNGKIEKITVSRVELTEFLDRIRNNPNSLVLYDKYEEDWKRTQKEVKKFKRPIKIMKMLMHLILIEVKNLQKL